MHNLILDRIIVEDKRVKYTFRAAEPIRKYFTKDNVTIEYDRNMESVPESILSIPFIGCIAGLSWMADIELWVNELDETFYQAFARIKRAYQEMHSDFPFKGDLVPCRFVENSTPKTGKSLLLFGGGIDCQSSFIRNKDSISDVLNIYAWLDGIDQSNKVDIHDDEFTKKFCAVAGKTSRHIRSDFFKVLNQAQIDRDFTRKYHTNYWYGYLHSPAFITMAIPMAYEQGLDRVIIASSFSKGIQGYFGSFITTDSQWRWAENGTTLHDGFELTRLEKVRLLVEHQKKNGKALPLHVCSFKDHECCVCDKCFRSIVQIVAEGGDPRDFGFDIKGSLRDFYSKAAPENVYLWDLPKEKVRYWPPTAARMKENYDNIAEKDFVDWFTTYDFDKAQKTGLKNYYRKNFWSILKRKLTGR